MKKLINSYSNDKIPEIVEVKWQDTMSLIKSGEVKKNPVKNEIPFVITKLVGGVAACFVLLVSISYANPVFAESIPFMSGIIDFLKGDEIVGNNAYLQQTEVEDFMTSVDETNPTVNIEQIEIFEIKDAFSDENILVFTLAMPLVEEFKNANNVNASLDIYINDVIVNEQSFAYLTNTGGGFVGLVDVAITDYIDDIDNYDLKVNVNKLSAIDESVAYESSYGALLEEGKTQEAAAYAEQLENLNEREKHELTYSYKQIEVEIDDMQFVANVKIGLEQTTAYAPNFSSNGCEIKSVVTSPVNTYVEYTMAENTYLQITDDLGNEISRLVPKQNSEIYHPLVEGTAQLYFEFVSMNDVTKNIAEFTLDIETGYITQEMHDFNDVYNSNNNAQVVETAKLPDLGIPDYFENRFEDDVIVEFGETVLIDSYMGTGQHEVTLSNLQIFDSLSDFGITPEQTSFADHDVYEGEKFVTVDVHVKNINATGIAYEGVGANTFGVQDFVKAQYRFTGEMDANYYEEIQYNSLAGNTAKGYYMVDMPENCEQTLTIGFFFDTQALEKGEIQFAYEMYDEDIGEYNTIVNVPQSLINID